MRNFRQYGDMPKADDKKTGEPSQNAVEYQKAVKLLAKLRRKLQRMNPTKVYKWLVPKTLPKVQQKIIATQARINYELKEAEDAELKRATAKAQSTKAASPNLTEGTEKETLTNKIAELQEKLESLTAKQRQSSLIGKIQLEKFDTSTEGKSMSKDDALKKWPRWKKCLDTIRNDASTPEVKHQHLLGIGGQFIRDVEAMAGFEPELITGDPFEDLVEKIDNYLKKDTAMKVHDMAMLARTIQEPNESIDQFFHRLQIAATACDFGDAATTSAKIREQLVAHGRHRKLILWLAAENKTLEQMISSIRLKEAGEAEERALAQTFKQPVSVLAVDNRNNRSEDERAHRRDYEARGARRNNSGYRESGSSSRDRSVSQSISQRRTTANRSCGGCGGTWHPKREDCDAWGKTCKKCGKQGHFAKVCRSNPGNDNNQRGPRQVYNIDQDDWPEADSPEQIRKKVV